MKAEFAATILSGLTIVWNRFAIPNKIVRHGTHSLFFRRYRTSFFIVVISGNSL
jgi:hypothetical protein